MNALQLRVIPLITAQVQPLNERLWALMDLERLNTITLQEKAELNGLCEDLERKSA